MTRAWCVLAALAACGDDGPSDAGVDGLILRPDSENDIDFDGVPNDVDNCPASSNGFQGNEDGDRFGDACDPCPPIADDNPPDGDGDGVADACDPKPIMFGDAVRFFEGFHQGKPAGWDQTPGTWTASNDQLVGSGTGHFALIVTDRTREIVSARITVESFGAGGGYFGVLDNRAQGGATGINCVQTDQAVRVFSTATPTDEAVTNSAATVPAGYLVELIRENQSYTCKVTFTAGTTAIRSYTLANTPYLSGLVVSNATIRVDWFMVVESL